MPTINVTNWHIYFCPMCHCAIPKKDKYVVAVYIDSNTIWGFLINSQINQYIRNRPYLLPCEAEIKASQHRCLAYDSFVDCRDIFAFNISDFTVQLDAVNIEAKKNILKAVRDCPVIARKHRNLILAADGHLLDDEEST